MTWRVIVGTLSLVATMILLGFVAVTEPDRMASFSNSYNARKVETGAALYESNCALCHGLRGEGLQGPALNTPDLIPPLGSNVIPKRMADVGWAGTPENYIRLTIAGGRPRPTVGMEAYNAVRMPTWSQEFGGPLRPDQVESLVAYIMNWGAAFQAGAATAPAVQGVGADITVALPAGDATKGQKVATDMGCVTCHVNTPVGPAWMPGADNNQQGVGTRAAERIKDPSYTGKATTPEQYLFESIVQPDAYLVPGFNPVMPKDFGQKIDAQNMADLIAYLDTLK
jgi:mono/diheme cytochrome c family protein